MSGQDMIWNRLPQTWYEAPFMGNGSMGTYICKEPGKERNTGGCKQQYGARSPRQTIKASMEEAACS